MMRGREPPGYRFDSRSFWNASSSVRKSRAAGPTRTIRMLRMASPFFTVLRRSRPAIVRPIAVAVLSSPARFPSVRWKAFGLETPRTPAPSCLRTAFGESGRLGTATDFWTSETTSPAMRPSGPPAAFS